MSQKKVDYYKQANEFCFLKIEVFMKKKRKTCEKLLIIRSLG